MSSLLIGAGAAILIRCIWDFAAVGRGTLSFVDAPKKLVINLAVLLYEQPTLRRRFGELYDRYCRSVRRWRPGRPFHEAGSSERQARPFSA